MSSVQYIIKLIPNTRYFIKNFFSCFLLLALRSYEEMRFINHIVYLLYYAT